jgi:hypothetical protein
MNGAGAATFYEDTVSVRQNSKRRHGACVACCLEGVMDRAYERVSHARMYDDDTRATRGDGNNRNEGFGV